MNKIDAICFKCIDFQLFNELLSRGERYTTVQEVSIGRQFEKSQGK